MSNDTRREGLREAGVIADAVFDEQGEGSREQRVAARIRQLIIERMNVGIPGAPPPGCSYCGTKGQEPHDPRKHFIGPDSDDIRRDEEASHPRTTVAGET